MWADTSCVHTLSWSTLFTWIHHLLLLWDTVYYFQFLFNQPTLLKVSTRGAVLCWNRGRVPPDSLVAPPPRFKSWLTILAWFLRSQNAPKSKFFGGPHWGSLQRSSPPSWWAGGLLPLPVTSSTLSALQASFLLVLGSNPGLVSTGLRV